MTYSDTKEVLRRIKSNYQSFVNDDYVLKEWYKELKDYDIEDVMNKLEEHMRSADYGSTIPKLYFLTKYLKKSNEKGLTEKYNLCCRFCNKYVSQEEFDKHYERCLDINYIVNIRKKHFDIEISQEMIERFRNMDEELFQVKYLEFLDNVYNEVPVDEQYRINQIINPRKSQISNNYALDDEIDYLERKMAQEV